MAKPSPLVHFEIPTSYSTDGNYKAKCKHCGTFISGSGKTSSNFTTHLKRKHLKIYEASQSTTGTSMEQTSLVSFQSFVPKKYSSNDSRQIRLNDALTSLVAETLLPLSIVESSAFRQFVECLEPRFVVPSRKHLSTTLLTKKHETIRKKVLDVLICSRSVSLTLDLWSNRQMRGFIGITCHYIVNWSLHSLMLACRRFKGRHTAENIAQYFDETITSHDISHKIVTTVTDNAANVVKAMSLPGFENTYSLEKDEDEDEEDELSEMEDFQKDILLNHDTCFSHTIQLVVKDGLDEIGATNTVLAKIAKIVSYVHKSQHATELLEGEYKLQKSNATRWNSQLKSIKSILRVPEEKLRSLDTTYQLTTYDRKILSDLVNILTPFQEATDLSQGQNIVTSSLVIPCIRGLQKALSCLSVTYNSRMLIALINSLDNRMSKFESREIFILASTLDPRFKLRWCQDSTEEEKAKKILLHFAKSSWKKNKEISTVHTDNTCHSEVTEITEPPPSKKRKESTLLSYLFEESNDDKRSNSDSLQTEISTYLSNPCMKENGNPLEFWKVHETNYPTLADLAIRYLAVPASSGPVERLFSIGGKFFRPERCCLSDSVFEKLMNIKCNGHVTNM